MLAKYSVFMLSLLVALPLPATAGSVQRIVHPDGRVEFTNAPARTQERVYRYQDEHGVTSFSSIRPVGVADVEVLRFDCYACAPDSTVDWHNTRLFVGVFQDEINAAAARFRVDPALVRAVIHAESAFNPQAVSRRGAQGLMQLMPATAAELGVENAMDVAENIHGGVNYLARMLQLHHGDIRLATAAYNAGPGAVRRHGGIPPFAETRAYVERVGILHQRYRQSLASR